MNNINIFFVDDDPEELEFITEILKEKLDKISLQYEVNGEKAMEKLNAGFSTGELPSLIILDLNMPKMNGTQTLQALKGDERFQDIPVIIYSTSVNSIEKDKCIGLGAHSYVTKPTTYSEAHEIVDFFLYVVQKP